MAPSEDVFYYDGEIEARFPINLAIVKPYSYAFIPQNKPYYVRTLRIPTIDQPESYALCKIKQRETLGKILDYTIETNRALNESELGSLLKKIKFELGIEESMFSLRKQAKKDLILRFALQSNPGMRLFANINIPEATVLTLIADKLEFHDYIDVVEQLVSNHGNRIPWDDKFLVFPSMTTLSDMEEDDWFMIGLDYKAKMLGRFDNKTFESIATYVFYPIYDRGYRSLYEMKSISKNIARLLLIYSARRYELVIFDEFVQQIIRHQYNINFDTQHQFDAWIRRTWTKNPAEILHAHLVNKFPKYRKDMDFSIIPSL